MPQFDVSEFEVPPEVAEKRIVEQQERIRPSVRTPRSDKLFVKVPIRYLINHRYPLSPHGRMWLWLLFKTKWGQRSVLFTSEDAEMLGVFHNKMRELRRLEAKGLIRITTRGTATVIVTLEDDQETARDVGRIDHWLGSF